jgi:hypothetical protein
MGQLQVHRHIYGTRNTLTQFSSIDQGTGCSMSSKEYANTYACGQQLQRKNSSLKNKWHGTQMTFFGCDHTERPEVLCKQIFSWITFQQSN